MSDTKMKFVVAQLPVLSAFPLWFPPPDPVLSSDITVAVHWIPNRHLGNFSFKDA